VQELACGQRSCAGAVVAGESGPEVRACHAD
jgi:hypothetical protein